MPKIEHFRGKRYLDHVTPMVIETDGRTVWVNDNTGCCVGRLSPVGIDVHRTGPDQLKHGTQCLDCAHDVPKAEMWAYFVKSMADNRQVTILAEFQPEWSKDQLKREDEEDGPEGGGTCL